MRNNLILLSTSIIFSIYLCEIFATIFFYSNFNDSLQKKISSAKSMNVDFDTRTPFEFFEDLKKENNNAYLYLNTFSLNNYNLADENIISFGSISNTITMLNNESGYYPIIITDEHGFNNPKGLYKKNINTILIGDSFVEGDGVKQSETIGAYLRNLNIETLSIGRGGFGPLSELALLIEYAKPLEPKNVFWFFYDGNDYIDLTIEFTDKKYSFLKNYFEKTFVRQNQSINLNTYLSYCFQ